MILVRPTRVSPTKALAYVILAAMLSSSMAEHSRALFSPQDFLDAHNAARAEVGVSPLVWDYDVAYAAQDYANRRAGDCDMVHSDGPYGENLAWASYDLSAEEAVKMWVDEKVDYNYYLNSCMGYKECKHYTQVVWFSSVRLGCGKVTCPDNVSTFVVCNYDPPGNYMGQLPFYSRKRGVKY